MPVLFLLFSISRRQTPQRSSAEGYGWAKDPSLEIKPEPCITSALPHPLVPTTWFNKPLDPKFRAGAQRS